MSKYNPNGTASIPSANHQSMQECGCIRYMVINDNIVDYTVGNVSRERQKKSIRVGKYRL